MNAPISRLYVLVLVMFAALVAFTSRWTVFEADALRDNELNRRPILEEQRIRRGTIRAADGTVLARSIRVPSDKYERRYPLGDLFGHPIGYYDVRFNKSELERFRNDELSGANDTITSILDQLRGKRREGDDLITTLDPDAQRIAVEALGGRKGSVVALDPKTGAVKTMVTVPGFDPNLVRQPRAFARADRFNRATQSGYAPGSTFKVVTAIAAIDSGRYQPSSQVSGKNNKKISGVPLRNFDDEDFGLIDLTTALTHSVNTVWAEVAEKLGKPVMGQYMERLGFGADPPLDLPDADMKASGEYRNGRLLSPRSRFVDVGRMGVGQDKLAVTPLQMAMVAAAVANGGRLMRPHITDRVVDRDGRTVDEIEPEQMSQVMSPEAASAVGGMMANVVREGTGTAAALAGIDVAGKTGTAEVDRPCGPNQAWFIAFAPERDPRVAIATTVECTSGTGGVEAAPIAKRVMESLLR